MTVVGAGEEHRLARRGAELLHQIRAAAKRPDRVAVSHRLPECGEIWRHPGDRLEAADRVAEPGDYLVEDEQSPVAVAKVPKAGEEAVAREHRADVVWDRLEDHCGHVAFC